MICLIEIKSVLSFALDMSMHDMWFVRYFLNIHGTASPFVKKNFIDVKIYCKLFLLITLPYDLF